MIVYRLARSKYSEDLSGTGAKMSGGRWNSKGTALLYTCQSVALCTTEIAVHTPLGILPDDYQLLTIQIPESAPLIEIAIKELPANWRSFPHIRFTQQLGDDIVKENRYAVIRVCSAVVPDEFNYLINPRHPKAKGVKIIKKQDYSFDPRLFLRG